MLTEISTIQGKLIQAVKGGGDKALWSIAKGKGSAAEMAREVIELSTSPYLNISLYEAINIVCKSVSD